MILDPLVDSTSAVTVASCMKVYFNCELLLRTVPTLLLLLVLCIAFFVGGVYNYFVVFLLELVVEDSSR